MVTLDFLTQESLQTRLKCKDKGDVEVQRTLELAWSSCLKRYALAGWWWCMSLIPALRRQRQLDLCEFEASLVYRAGFKATEKPCLELQPPQKRGMHQIYGHRTPFSS